MENSPTKKEEKNLMPMQNRKTIPGMENFDMEDLIYPMIKLVHPTTKDAPKDAKIGQFYNTVSKEIIDNPELIFITYKKEMKAWEDAKTRQEGEPKPQYKVLALTKDKFNPVILYIGGVSFWNLRKYFNQFFQAGLPLWSTVTGMASVKKEGKMGNYYAIEFEALEDTEEDKRAYFFNFYDSIGRGALDRSDEEEERDKATAVTDVDVSEDEEVTIEDPPFDNNIPQ